MSWYNYVPILNTAIDAAKGNWGDAAKDYLDPFHIGRSAYSAAKGELFDKPVEQQQQAYQSAIDLLGSQGRGIAKNQQDAAKRAQAFYAPAAEAYNKIYGPGNGRYGQPGQTMSMPVPGGMHGADGSAISPTTLAALTPASAQAPSQNNTQANPASLPHGTPLGVYVTGPDGVQKWVPYR